MFEINCPTVNSQKFWITNGAYYANHAVVFAQTYIPNSKGEYSHEGINAFLVKLRDEDGNLLPGVTIDDMGAKPGMNGVDNARIIFRNVQVEKKMLLDNITKMNQISEKGFEMVSNKDIKSKRDRFLAASNRLLSGRLCISCICLSEAKMSLITLNNYSKMRLSNGKSGLSDTPINDYQLYQNQILPLIVKTLVFNSGLNYVRNEYSNFIVNKLEDSKHFNQIVRLCCVIKPLLAWHANQVANICRERAGGQGYLSINRIESGVAVAHSAITAEGDSAVLMQKVSKEYVDDYSKGKLFNGVLPVLSNGLNIGDFKISNENKKSVFNYLHLLDLIKARELILLEELAKLNKESLKSRESIYELWMHQGSDIIQQLAEVFGERICLEHFITKFSEINGLKEFKEKLNKISALFAATHVKKYLSFFLLNDLISKESATTFNQEYNDLIKDIKLFSDEIIDGFGVPKDLIIAPIANDYGKYYEIDKTDGEFIIQKDNISRINQIKEFRPKF